MVSSSAKLAMDCERERESKRAREQESKRAREQEEEDDEEEEEEQDQEGDQTQEQEQGKIMMSYSLAGHRGTSMPVMVVA